MDLNVGKVKEILKDCDDVVYRDFKVGVKQNFSLCIVYVDGLINKESVSDFVLESLMEGARGLEPTPKGIKDNLIELITKGNISITEIEEVSTIEETIDAILSGETALFIDKYDKAIILSSRGWPTRSINESQSETVVRGPRDAFTETLKVNITLIRRRIKIEI